MNLDALVDALKSDEGYRQFVYDDATGKPIVPGYTVVGIPTIGYGRGLSNRGVSIQEAADMVRRDALQGFKEAADLVSNFVLLDDVRQGVLANMAMNMGKSRLAGFTKMLAAVEAKNFALAATEMRQSLWAKQVGPRAARLAAEMETGSA
jgi:lysozyme